MVKLKQSAVWLLKCLWFKFTLVRTISHSMISAPWMALLRRTRWLSKLNVRFLSQFWQLNKGFPIEIDGLNLYFKGNKLNRNTKRSCRFPHTWFDVNRMTGIFRIILFWYNKRNCKFKMYILLERNFSCRIRVFDSERFVIYYLIYQCHFSRTSWTTSSSPFLKPPMTPSLTLPCTDSYSMSLVSTLWMTRASRKTLSWTETLLLQTSGMWMITLRMHTTSTTCLPTWPSWITSGETVAWTPLSSGLIAARPGQYSISLLATWWPNQLLTDLAFEKFQSSNTSSTFVRSALPCPRWAITLYSWVTTGLLCWSILREDFMFLYPLMDPSSSTSPRNLWWKSTASLRRSGRCPAATCASWQGILSWWADSRMRWSNTGLVRTSPRMGSPEMTSPGPMFLTSGSLTVTRPWWRSWPTSSGVWITQGWKEIIRMDELKPCKNTSKRTKKSYQFWALALIAFQSILCHWFQSVWPDWAIYSTLGNLLKPLATIFIHT